MCQVREMNDERKKPLAEMKISLTIDVGSKTTSHTRHAKLNVQEIIIVSSSMKAATWEKEMEMNGAKNKCGS